MTSEHVGAVAVMLALLALAVYCPPRIPEAPWQFAIVLLCLMAFGLMLRLVGRW